MHGTSASRSRVALYEPRASVQFGQRVPERPTKLPGAADEIEAMGAHPGRRHHFAFLEGYLAFTTAPSAKRAANEALTSLGDTNLGVRLMPKSPTQTLLRRAEIELGC